MTQSISLSNKRLRLLTKYSESPKTEALSTHIIGIDKVCISSLVISLVIS